MKLFIMLATATLCFAMSGQAQSQTNDDINDNNGNDVVNSISKAVSDLARKTSLPWINAPAAPILNKTANEIDQNTNTNQNSSSTNQNSTTNDDSNSGSSWSSSSGSTNNSSQTDSNSSSSSDTNSDNEPPLNK